MSILHELLKSQRFYTIYQSKYIKIYLPREPPLEREPPPDDPLEELLDELDRLEELLDELDLLGAL
jgi:hypothetical protein